MKPAIRLANGNAYAVLSQCIAAAERADWLLRDWRAWRKKATSGDYAHLLEAVRESFDVTTTATFSEQPQHWFNNEGEADNEES